MYHFSIFAGVELAGVSIGWFGREGIEYQLNKYFSYVRNRSTIFADTFAALGALAVLDVLPIPQDYYRFKIGYKGVVLGMLSLFTFFAPAVFPTLKPEGILYFFCTVSQLVTAITLGFGAKQLALYRRSLSRAEKGDSSDSAGSVSTGPVLTASL